MNKPYLRQMTAVYLMDGRRILLLHRVGSRVGGDNWRGIGGHLEPSELGDPTASLLRELREETGFLPEDLEGLSLRYITLRRVAGEIRQNHYFFAALKDPGRPLPDCREGTLAWASMDQALDWEMPLTAKAVLEHYQSLGHRDSRLYFGAVEKNRIQFFELHQFTE